jgi:hypothetical protein
MALARGARRRPTYLVATIFLLLATALPVGAVGSDDDPVDVTTSRDDVAIAVDTPVPSPTPTIGPTFTVRSASAPNDCSLVPPGQADPRGRWLILAGAAFVMIRRRRSSRQAAAAR